MAFFFKKDFSTFAGYEVLAGHSIPFAATLTSEFLKFSPQSSQEWTTIIFAECLAFATAIQGMKLQSEYKIRTDAEIQHFLKRLLKLYEGVATAQESPTKLELKRLVGMALVLDFVELFGIYGRREFTAFATEDAMSNFVKTTGRSWGMAKGTSTVLATVMFQFRLVEILSKVEYTHSTLNSLLLFSQLAADSFTKDCFKGSNGLDVRQIVFKHGKGSRPIA